ncbi:hypothetical protein WKK05_07885 [Nostoc sp. UHCC 0302]|uniref:Y-family DNA polymerase n=1 Tax=Nostoc sp. UHCC 0302 TaxID=3134896 RepID=UPI00311C9DE2
MKHTWMLLRIGKTSKYASTIARHIKTAIFQETKLTATAGVSINKFLAKMASGQNKPNGLTVILPEDAIAFIEQQRIEKFYGIGEVTVALMHSLGIHTGAESKERSLLELTHYFGKAGHYCSCHRCRVISTPQNSSVRYTLDQS